MLEFDIRAFFDSVPHDLVVRAVEGKHSGLPVGFLAHGGFVLVEVTFPPR
jgi:retron-type reverse transcriptase